MLEAFWSYKIQSKRDEVLSKSFWKLVVLKKLFFENEIHLTKVLGFKMIENFGNLFLNLILDLITLRTSQFKSDKYTCRSMIRRLKLNLEL